MPKQHLCNLDTVSAVITAVLFKKPTEFYRFLRKLDAIIQMNML